MHIIITHDYSDRQLVCCGSAVTHPFYIHLDSDGSAFVIDHRNVGYVYHYDMDGNFNTSFQPRGYPCDTAIKDNYLLITDFQNNKVYKYI